MGTETLVSAVAGGLLGLLIGSFLNVVIHRLPRMLELQWADEYSHLAGREPEKRPAFNLLRPRSSCPACQHQIRWFENVPVLSYLILRGRCSVCRTRISPRYPLVEIATAVCFAWTFAQLGFTPAALAWSGLAAALLSLMVIDWDTTLLPDDITLPLVWAGLIAAALGWTGTSLPAALWGAVAGYLSLWSIFWLFKLTTGKEGMGFGDFKLFAALGAWFGVAALIPIILAASIVGTVVGLVLKLGPGLRANKIMPFGPFLGSAGLVMMFTGIGPWLRWIGW